MKTNQGYTLVELLVTLAVISVLVFLAIAAVGPIKANAEAQLAISRAQALNIAKSSYIAAVGSAAATTTWDGNDADDWALIRGNVQYSPANLADFVPEGFSFNLGSTVNDPVTVIGPDGTQLNY